MGAVPKLRVVQPTKRTRLPSISVSAVPTVGEILGYRSIWVMAQLSADGRRLKGTHYAVCLVGGSAPLWALFTIGGKHICFAGSRKQLEKQYPKHVWRRHPAKWTFSELAPRKTIDRKNYALRKHGASK